MSPMHQVIVARLCQRFDAYLELARGLDDASLTQTLDLPKHKSLAAHLWCVIGARESYARALAQGSWAGFACSMQAYAPCDFLEKLGTSAAAVTEAVEGVEVWTSERAELLASLAEHEVMHEGQIIRHVYALGRELPESWFWA